jgi:hypothetical protein
MKSQTDTVIGWIEDRRRDASFRAEVERMLNEMRGEEDAEDPATRNHVGQEAARGDVG